MRRPSAAELEQQNRLQNQHALVKQLFGTFLETYNESYE